MNRRIKHAVLSACFGIAIIGGVSGCQTSEEKENMVPVTPPPTPAPGSVTPMTDPTGGRDSRFKNDPRYGGKPENAK